MVKTILFGSLLSLVSLALCGQVKPDWTSVAMREASYPSGTFFTGYSQGNVRAGETVQDAKQRLSRDAQGLLSESIRMRIISETTVRSQSTRANQSERLIGETVTTIETLADAEIAGINSEEPFHDTQTGIIHAFVWVNRFELSGYHRASLSMNLSQAEGALQTASDLEASGEKSKARQQCQAAIPLLVKVRQSQSMLTAIDASISDEALQLARTEALNNRLVNMQARLAQAIYLHFESAESNFSRQSTVLANRLKSLLSAKGCSFTDNPAQADFRLKIGATTRQHAAYSEYDFVICFADVVISLFDVRRNVSVFHDEFSQRGISTSRDDAGRRALEEAAPVIAGKISQWIE